MAKKSWLCCRSLEEQQLDHGRKLEKNARSKLGQLTAKKTLKFVAQQTQCLHIVKREGLIKKNSFPASQLSSLTYLGQGPKNCIQQHPYTTSRILGTKNVLQGHTTELGVQQQLGSCKN
jgi:hypothetical protein